MVYGLILFLLAADTQKVSAATPLQFERLAKEADSARQADRLDAAAALYRKALKLKPRWKEGWWYLGTMFYDRDRYSEAREDFQKFVALDPKAGAGWALLGLCEFQTKEYSNSMRNLLKARNQGIESAQMRDVVMYHTALLFTHFEQYEAAQQILQAMALRGEAAPSIVIATGLAGLRKPLLPDELPPQDRDIVTLAGEALCAANMRKVPEARDQFQQLVRQYGDRPNVHYVYGTFLLAGDPVAALQEFDKELEINPGHVPALVSAGMEYLKEGEAAKGLPYAERAVQADPQNFAAHAALGRILTETGPLDRAIHELETSERLAPDSPQVRFALASAYTRAGRKDQAAREHEEFLRLQKLADSSSAK